MYLLWPVLILFCSCSNQTDHNKFTPIIFERSTQIFPPFAIFQIGLADLDSDGDSDAVFSMNDTNHCRVLFNDGKGTFIDSCQRLTERGHGVGMKTGQTLIFIDEISVQ